MEVICTCGCNIALTKLKRHQQSKKHFEKLARQEKMEADIEKMKNDTTKEKYLNRDIMEYQYLTLSEIKELRTKQIEREKIKEIDYYNRYIKKFRLYFDGKVDLNEPCQCEKKCNCIHLIVKVL